MSEPLHNELAPDSIEARDLRHLLHPNTNLGELQRQGPAVHSEAKGVYLWDNHGKQYLEGMAGLWCTALGYGVEELADAASEQLKKLSYSQLFGGKTNEPSVLLAEKLMEIVPIEGGRVFFGLTGSDANDTQIKMMWYYHNLIGRPEKKKIISRWTGYHGVTVASGSLTGLPPFHKAFDLPIQGILHTESPHYYREAREGETEDQFTTRLANSLSDLIEEEGPETVAAFIAEPVLGAGGVIVPQDDYFPRIREICDKYGIILIFDEVITGWGRTGSAFASQEFGVTPDVMTMAKATTNGVVPMGVVAVKEEIYDAVMDSSPKGAVELFHGYTYSGHPVAAAAGLATLDIYENENLFRKAEDLAIYLEKSVHELVNYPYVKDIRNIGLAAAIELEPRDGAAGSRGFDVYCKCFEEGCLTRVTGDIIAIAPALIAKREHVDRLVETLGKVLRLVD